MARSFERKESKMRNWLETSNGEMFSAAEAAASGIRIVSQDEAFMPLPKDVDAAADWLHRHDPDEGGAPVPVR